MTGEPVKRVSGASAHCSPATVSDGAGRYRLTAEKAPFLEYRFCAFEDIDNGRGELVKLGEKETRTSSLRTIAGGQ